MAIADEITRVIRDRIQSFEGTSTEAAMVSVGTVIEVADGIARVYGLSAGVHVLRRRRRARAPPPPARRDSPRPRAPERAGRFRPTSAPSYGDRAARLHVLDLHLGSQLPQRLGGAGQNGER